MASFFLIPKKLHFMCECNDFALFSANTGIALASTANSALDGSGSLSTVVTAALLGTVVKSVTIKAIAPVTSGMVRLFITVVRQK